jgi:hypothetical protein
MEPEMPQPTPARITSIELGRDRALAATPLNDSIAKLTMDDAMVAIRHRKSGRGGIFGMHN